MLHLQESFRLKTCLQVNWTQYLKKFASQAKSIFYRKMWMRALWEDGRDCAYSSNERERCHWCSEWVGEWVCSWDFGTCQMKMYENMDAQRRSETILEIFEAQRFWKGERTVGILRATFASSTIKWAIRNTSRLKYPLRKIWSLTLWKLKKWFRVKDVLIMMRNDIGRR